MIRSKRLTVAVCTGAAGAALLAAGPAAADTPLPAPPSTGSFCPAPIQEPDGSLIAGQEANGAGCVVVHLTSDGGTLESVILAPGWTWRDDSSGGGDTGGGKHGGGGHGGGQSGRAGTDIDVVFTEPTTGQHVEVRMRPGRTDITSF